MPRRCGGAPQFGADGETVVVAQEEDGVGAGIGVEGAGVDERGHEPGGQMAGGDQVVAHRGQLVGSRRWQSQFGAGW